MSERIVISSGGAPAAIGPYSQAVRAGGLVFVSGQIPLDPATGALVAGGAAAQAERALASLQAILESAGSGLHRVVKTTIYLTDLSDFAAVNEVYARFFPAQPPARATVQVAALPRGAAIEIEAVALAGAG
ncbi:MAG TPA: Rid family detoxifying hydrolase [Candidatus Methanoperedens sp.]|nr:Rid family detoxifying hydrolase [Candidatus Methanoperedens sp.]